MEWLWAHADHIGAAFTVLASAWALLLRAKRFIRHAIIETVQEGFATKQDFANLDTKLDTLLQLAWGAVHSRRDMRVEIAPTPPDMEHGA